MGMINDIIENAKEVFLKFGEKANDAYDVTKLNALKSRIGSDIDKAYKKLGEEYYQVCKSEKLDTADFSALLSTLDELHAQYDTIVKQIEDIKNLKRCPVCGRAQENVKPFCADCGAKL